METYFNWLYKSLDGTYIKLYNLDKIQQLRKFICDSGWYKFTKIFIQPGINKLAVIFYNISEDPQHYSQTLDKAIG